MLKPVVAAVVVLAVAGGVAFWAYARGDDSAKAETQLIRWVNVTVEAPSPPERGPQDSGLLVTRDFFWQPESTTPAIIISPLDKSESSVVVDAETGAILFDKVQDEDRAAIDEVLKTVRVSPLDRRTAPWPYSGRPPNVAREEIGNISFIPPDPASGIRIISGIGDPGGFWFIEVSNGRSWFGIDAATGEVYQETARILPEDREAFDRLLSDVDHVGPSR